MKSQPSTPDPNPSVLPGALGPCGRPSWSGLLQFSLVSIPVKAFPAVSSSEATHFHQLHADCGQRIRYEKRCPTHGPVEAAAIVKGYPYAPDRYVVVDADELDRLRPVQDRALRLERFLDAQHVDPVLFAGRCLYLRPDGLAAHRPYQVLTETLRQRNKWALGRVILSGHRQLILVRPTGRLLACDVLHYPSHVRAAAPGSDVSNATASVEELQLASMLVDAASGPVDWSGYRDDSAVELRALVEAKIAGQSQSVPGDEPVAVLSLLDALKQSVAAVAGSAAAAATPTSQPRRKSRRRIA
jgi:DNA end-binding protein Ku